MTLPLVGAALTTPDLPRYADWLIEGGRDLELQDFIATEVILGDWRPRVEAARKALDGHSGRLGIHGPFINLPIDANDPEIGPIITRRYLTGLEICAALGATQMVVHSPFSTWDFHNLDDHPRRRNRPSAREAKIAAVRDVLGPVVRRAAQEGVTLVLENIEDVVTADRIALAEALDPAVVRLSVDTGHAHCAHHLAGGPPVDYAITQAGARLEHVHLQDADGHADRHWAPGRGTIAWHGVFAALAALPVQPRLLLELRDPGDIAAAMAWLGDQGLAA